MPNVSVQASLPPPGGMEPPEIRGGKSDKTAFSKSKTAEYDDCGLVFGNEPDDESLGGYVTPMSSQKQKVEPPAIYEEIDTSTGYLTPVSSQKQSNEAPAYYEKVEVPVAQLEPEVSHAYATVKI